MAMVAILQVVWPDGSEAILSGLATVDEFIVMPARQTKLRALFEYTRRIRSLKPSHVVVAWPPGVFSGLLALLSGAPVRVGHELEVNFPRTMSLARQKGQYARIKSGKVLRVERKNVLTGTNIGLAVEFDQ